MDKEEKMIDCKHCTSDGECTIFNCRCDGTGYCGVKDET